MNVIDKINEKQIRKDIPEFRVGDTVKVLRGMVGQYRIKERGQK